MMLKNFSKISVIALIFFLAMSAISYANAAHNKEVFMPYCCTQQDDCLEQAFEMVLCGSTLKEIKMESTVLDRIKYTQRGVVTPDLLAALFGLDEVLIGDAIYSTAAEKVDGSDFTSKNIWEKTAGRGSAFLFYRPDSPGLKKPSSGYQARTAGDNGQGRRTTTWREAAEHQDVYEVAEETDTLITGADLGFLWYDTIAACFICRIKYTQRGVVTPDLLAALFGLDEVLIGDAIYSTAAEKVDGSDFTSKNIWEKTAGRGSAFLFYRPDSPGLKKPSSGYQARTAGDNGQGRRTTTWREAAEHQDVYEVAEETDILITGADLGFLWYDTIATGA